MTATTPAVASLLEVDGLCINFGPSRVVDRVSFAIDAGEKFALVGESGSGKSVTALSVLRLLETATYQGLQSGGWTWILSNMKTYLETGEPMPQEY